MSNVSKTIRESRLRQSAWRVGGSLHKSRKRYVWYRYYLVRHGEIVASYQTLDDVERDFGEAEAQIREAKARCMDRRYGTLSKGVQK